MRAIAHVDQYTFNRFWSNGKRFIGLHGPNVSGRDIEIQSDGDRRRITGLVTEYADGVNTIEIFERREQWLKEQ